MSDDPVSRCIVYHPELDPELIYAPKGWTKQPMSEADEPKLFVGPNCHNLTDETVKFAKEAIKMHTKAYPIPKAGKPAKTVKPQKERKK